MTAIEVILAALVAGAAAGTTKVASTAVLDAYTRLRELLRGRLERGPRPDGQVPGTGAGDGELRRRLELSGAAHDQEVLAAAQRLLALVDPAGTAAGRYRFDGSSTSTLHVGDIHLDVNDNYGAAGVFNAPVTLETPPVPPAPPGSA